MSAGFTHEALLYATPDEFLGGCVPFVTEGLAADEPVLVVTPPGNGDLLRAALGADADRVRFHDMTREGRNPGRIIPWVLRAFADEHAGRPVRIVAEAVWAGRTAVEYPACVQHEALVNLAFAEHEAMLLCPYDAGSLAPRVLFDAAQTHPVVVEWGGRRPSDVYTAPEAVVASFNRPFPEPRGRVPSLAFDVDDLTALRDFVGMHGRRAGLTAWRVEDLQAAANEAATNSVKHAGGSGTLRIWRENGSVVCEVSDPGVIKDPMVGRLPPRPDHDAGRGLLLVNLLCDLVRSYTDEAGTTIRMYMRF